MTKKTPPKVEKAVLVELYEDGNLNIVLQGEFAHRAEAIGLLTMGSHALSPAVLPPAPKAKGGQK